MASWRLYGGCSVPSAVLLCFLELYLLQNGAALLCYCNSAICETPKGNFTCIAKPETKCFKHVRLVEEEKGEQVEHLSYGCLEAEAGTTMQCKSYLLPKSDMTIECCSDRDYCNQHLDPKFTYFTSTNVPGSEGVTREQQLIILIIAVISFAIILSVFIAIVVIKYKRRKPKFDEDGENETFIHDNDSLKDLIEQSSGSGSGLPILVQRTIAKQIHLVQSVGKGRYGEVWKAKWRGEDVAVKIFFTTEEASWFRETELYQTVLLRHENILGFIAADIKGTGSWTQLFLITEYHENGSLHDYLLTKTLSYTELLRIVSSIINGLCHLHTEIHGTKGKPAMAHRDIKTKNILVKRNGTCCIADLGLAVKYNSETNDVDIAANTRQGTKRYMAPEVLADTINVRSFDAFRQADMYSFALVLWEVCRRTVSHGKADDYQIPYHDCVPNDPSFDDMKAVVYDRNLRPHLSNRWFTDDYLKVLVKVMQECWSLNAMARLTALRVRKTICRLIETHEMSVKSELV